MTDETNRRRFVEKLNRNFSVIAPAGVGKTSIIVERILHMATANSERAAELLPKLAVVTYTNKAAGEMQQRARRRLAQHAVDPVIARRFNQAFFGTIHSFCLKLLRQHGHFLGLPGKLELLRNERDLWTSWMGNMRQLNDSAGVLRYVSVFDVFELAAQMPPLAVSEEKKSSPLPKLDLSELLNFPPNSKSKGNVEKGQQLAREWLEKEKKGGFNPLPKFEKGGAQFQQVWKTSFRPLRRWLSDETLRLATRLAREFRAHCIARGQLTYDDQIELAEKLLQHPQSGPRIRQHGYHIILDEAQDTDPAQFRVLLGAASEKPGNFLSPRAGAFCMGGDPQQSIYGDRADLHFYQKVRQDLVAAGGEELTLTTTFRCGREILKTVNQLGPLLLDGAVGQADYVPFEPAPSVSAGQVVKWKGEISSLDLEQKKKNETSLAREEADELARRIQEAGLQGLRARSWGQVAVLCPRRRWLMTLMAAFRKRKMVAQVQSSRDRMSDSPFYLWLTALSAVISQPRESFELVGVLREVYGLADSWLAEFSQGEGILFQIEEPAEERKKEKGAKLVAEKLNQLHKLRQEVLHLPLRDAVARLIAEIAPRIDSISELSVPAGEKDGALVRAAQLEAQGKTFLDWAQELREHIHDEKPEEEPRSDAIQLITCQKAKGLEWDAVILPFLFRKIRPQTDIYPHLLRREGGEPALLLDSADWDEETREWSDLRARQERRRLLYVALTRARHTLLLIDDEKCFGENEFSFASDIPNKAKGESKIPGKAALTPGEKIPKDSPPSFQKETAVSEKNWKLAHAAPFFRRTLPHQLAHGGEKGEKKEIEAPEQRLLALPEETEWAFAAERAAALDYGIWWHHMCEKMPWSQGRGAWQNHFEAWLRTVPAQERARPEWEGFLSSELAQILAADVLVHTEWPVLHLVSEDECVEGVIDLAIYDRKREIWTVIDWKTDRAPDADELLAGYRPQLTAYQQALQPLCSQVRAGVYSTPLSKLAMI